MQLSNYISTKPFNLESGITLPGYHLTYSTAGKLNEAGDNVIWVFHALTANSNPIEWWPGLVGTNKIFDPISDFIICVNMPGSCYGSIGPLTINKKMNQYFLHDFPFFTPNDMIRSYQALRQYLGIKKIKIGIGGSMGGQQLLEWAITEPDLFETIIPIATNAVHSAWGKAFNASQRMCIEMDPSWKSDYVNAGMTGMNVARSIALLSYRHYETYQISQTDTDDFKLKNYNSESYQKYQGEKLAKRFNAYSYYFLSKSMDAHNVGRGRGSLEKGLQKIKAKAIIIGIDSDILFPIQEQKFIANHIPSAQLNIIHSQFGHDGFLLEYNQIANIIAEALVLQY